MSELLTLPQGVPGYQITTHHNLTLTPVSEVHRSRLYHGPTPENSITETTNSSTEDPDNSKEVEKPKEPTYPYSSYSGYTEADCRFDFPEIK